MLGLTDFGLHGAAAARAFQADEQRALRDGAPIIDHEEIVVDASGAKRWLSSTQVPLRNSRDEICGLVGIARDITRRKQQQEEGQAAERRERETMEANSLRFEALAGHLSRARDEAVRASEAKSRFLTGVTHELRTPLHGILGHAENPGGGSVFWLELPLLPAAADDATQTPATQASATQASAMQAPALQAAAMRPSLRVLVVDDIAMNRDIVSRALVIAGHAIVCVKNGEAAVDAVAEGAFDVVLMDVGMPGMDGLEATRRIRSLPSPNGQVPMVAVTAQAHAEQIALCGQAGMDAHVGKPFEPETLIAIVEALARTGQEARQPSGQPEPAVPTPAHRLRDRQAPEQATGPTDAAVQSRAVPMHDRDAFRQIVELLSGADVEAHLRTLIERGEALARGLRGPDLSARADALAEAAHTLCGSAGLYGFLGIAAAARVFEQAVTSHNSLMPGVAEELAVAIEASLAIMRREHDDIAAVTQG